MAARKRAGLSSQKAGSSTTRGIRKLGASSTSRKSYRQGYKSRQDESLGARRGARKSLKRNVSAAGRRAMASGPRKAAGGKKYGLSSRERR